MPEPSLSLTILPNPGQGMNRFGSLSGQSRWGEGEDPILAKLASQTNLTHSSNFQKLDTIFEKLLSPSIVQSSLRL